MKDKVSRSQHIHNSHFTTVSVHRKERGKEQVRQRHKAMSFFASVNRLCKMNDAHFLNGTVEKSLCRLCNIPNGSGHVIKEECHLSAEKTDK